VSRRSWILLGLLSAAWGASYMFIKVALDDGVPPGEIVFVRLALGALVLWPIALRLGVLGGLRPWLPQIALLALVQIAAPFVLITFGEQSISSSLTGILVATAPIFTFLLAFGLEGAERASGPSLAGVAIGIVGVALLLGFETGGELVGGLLVVAASVGYAVGAWYVKRGFQGTEPIGLLAANLTASALMTAPLLALESPSLPTPEAVGSLAVLGVVGTGLAFVIMYTLIDVEGPARASLVGYIAPGFAVVYGVTLLDESFTALTAVGLVLTVGGSWLAAQGSQLSARGVDVAASCETNRGPDAAGLEGVLEGGDRVAAGSAER
jgi:drug/metabolite transporter (DMT)-like permease